MPRQSDYNEEIATAICEKLAEGKSLRSICEGEDFPSKTTVLRWLEAHEPFRAQYARAREAQADTLFDECIDIADDGHNDFMLRKHGETESWAENGEAIQRSKLRIDARKWMAGKLQPKKYGEKVMHAGADGTGPVVVEIIKRTYANSTPS